MALRIVKISQSRFGCRERIPVLSEGGIVLREECCIFGAGHDGPHRSPSGGIVVNRQDADKMLHGTRKLY